MSFTLQPVQVANDLNEEGTLVFDGVQRLEAVSTRLSEDHDVARRWFLEAGFGRLDGPNHPTFPDLEAAEQWLDERPGQVKEG